MRICIDATPLLLRSAGVKNYLYYWILHLRRAAGETRIETFPFDSVMGALHHERSIVPRWPTLAGLARLHVVNLAPLGLLDRLGRGLDIFHVSHLLRRPPRTCRLTATVYDFTCWLLPEMHTRANVAAAKAFAERVLRRADGLIAISESTRRDAARILGLEAERIKVIYPGVAGEFFEVPAGTVSAVRRRYGLDKPYVAFVGTIEPRKNVRGLLEAYQTLPEDLRRCFDLVLAGPVGWKESGLAKHLRAAKDGGVRYLGYIPEEALPGLTAGATVLAYPSLYEGFGFPVAQAMAAGVPVITSNVSSLPELTAGAALLIDPHSVSELRAALERLLSDADRRAELARRGVEVAQNYRWETCARQSLEFFRRVAGGN